MRHGLRAPRRPLFPLRLGGNVVGLLLDDDTHWTELAEVLTDSYCLQAPVRMAAQIERPG